MPESDLLDQEEVRQQLLTGSSALQRYLNRHTADASDAADFYQESIARVMEQARERPIRNPIAYAIRIARNLMINHSRNEFTDSEVLDTLECPSPSPEDHASQAQNLQLLNDVLAALPPLRRAVLVRRRLQGESREQIAAALGISEEAVKKHITRALGDLQRALDTQS